MCFNERIHKWSEIWKNRYCCQLKIFVTVTSHSVGISIVYRLTCIMLKFIGINKEKRYMSSMQGVHMWQGWESINMSGKCIVHMHINAELKTYLCYLYAQYWWVYKLEYSRHALAGIFVQGHMPIMWNAWITVFLVIVDCSEFIWGICIMTYLS